MCINIPLVIQVDNSLVKLAMSWSNPQVSLLSQHLFAVSCGPVAIWTAGESTVCHTERCLSKKATALDANGGISEIHGTAIPAQLPWLKISAPIDFIFVTWFVFLSFAPHCQPCTPKAQCLQVKKCQVGSRQSCLIEKEGTVPMLIQAHPCLEIWS